VSLLSASGQWTAVAGLPELRIDARPIVRSPAGIIHLWSELPYQSTDGGRSWTPSAVPQAVEAASNGALFYTTTSGTAVRRSTDEGVTWTTLTLPARSSDAFIVASHDVREILAPIADRRGLAISSDQGETWRTLDTSIDGNRLGLIRIGPHSILAVSNGGASGSSSLFRSTDTGSTWTRIATSASRIYDAGETTRGTLVYLNDEAAFLSGAGGGDWSRQWIQLCGGRTADPTRVAVGEYGEVFLGTVEDGLYVINDLEWWETRFVRSMNPTTMLETEQALYASRVERGAMSADGGSTWRCLRGAPEAIDASGWWYRSLYQVERSSDSGATWTVIPRDLSQRDYTSYSPVVTPRGTVLAAFHDDVDRMISGVQRLEPSGWTDIVRHDEVVHGALSVGGDGMVYYVAAGRLDRSTDDGSTFHAVDSVHGFASVTAGPDGTLYAISATSPWMRLVRSEDHGATWQLLDPGEGIVYSVAAHGDDGVAVIVAIEGEPMRLMYSSDRGESFARAMDGLGEAEPQSLYSAKGPSLFVATTKGPFRLDGVSAVPASTEIDRLDLTFDARRP
jgi:photosystem II stability/assembly factor-like uncharacterized protein